jgi:DnaJ-class molecular chaperone
MSKCSVCNGTGKVFGGYSEATQPESGHQHEEWETCGNCEGSGYIDAKDSGGRLFGGSSSIAGDKIKRREPYSGHAGLKAFLSALGIELPSETQ